MLDERPIALRRPLRRRGPPIGRLLVILVAVAATLASASPRSLARATTDRPDEVAGPQFHVVYAVPADGEDRHLDENGTIEGSVSSFQRWLAGETGGKAFRLDTYQRGLDVTFVRLSKTDADSSPAIDMSEKESRSSLRQLASLPRTRSTPSTTTASHDTTCADSFWPPAASRHGGRVYLRGLPNFHSRATRIVSPAANQAPAYLEYSMVHEFVHALGFVAPAHRITTAPGT